MKRIISVRLKSDDPSKREQFLRGSDRTMQTKIINLLEKNPEGNYDFLIDDDGNKYVQDIYQLQGEVINVIDDNCIAEFVEDENGNASVLISQYEGALPQQHTVHQLKMVRKLSKKTDIGDRISDMNKQGGNIQYIRNPIDSGIESHQDYENTNKKFEPNWNLKRIKPFKTFFLDQPTSNKTSHKKKKK